MGRDTSCSIELTDDIKLNAEKLIEVVNLLLTEIGITKVTVSSGWRPPSINSKVANAAKKSLHMTGLAIDLADNDGSIKDAVMKNIDLLKKYDLFLENTAYTKTWVHLDLGKRSKRPQNIFTP